MILITWVLMIKHKNDVLKRFASFVNLVQNEKSFLLLKLGVAEFDSVVFEIFVKIMVFIMTSLPGLLNETVVEKKKLQEFTRSMLNEYDLPKYFWAEAVNTACYVSNRVLIRLS